MRWLLVILLLAMPVAAQAPSGLDVVIEGHRFDIGPETWKDERTVDDQASFTERISGWDSTLGTYLDVSVEAHPRGGQAGNDWSYRAWLTDGVTEVEGLVAVDPAGRFTARFDVDGQRALPGLAAVPALTHGTWILRVRAYSDDASGNPVTEGSGQAQLITQALPAQAPVTFNKTVPSVQVPAQTLPQITELGPDPVWFNRAPHATGIPVFFGAQGQGLQWSAWWIDSFSPLQAPAPLGTPQTTWGSQALSAAEGEGLSRAGFVAADGVECICIVTVVDPIHGGSRVWALGVSDAPMAMESLRGPRAGAEGPVRVGMDTPPATLLTAAPGDLHALAIQEQGATLITSSPLLMDGEEHVSTVLDGRLLRAHQGPYRLLAFMESAGAYTGHVVYDRGLNISLDLPRLGEGTPTKGALLLENLGDDGRGDRNPRLQINGTARLTIGDTVTVLPFEVLEGGSISIPFEFTPAAAGTLAISITIDTGDTFTNREQVVDVIDAETFEKEQKEWYDPGKYVPGPSLGILLLGLAAVVRKR